MKCFTSEGSKILGKIYVDDKININTREEAEKELDFNLSVLGLDEYDQYDYNNARRIMYLFSTIRVCSFAYGEKEKEDFSLYKKPDGFYFVVRSMRAPFIAWDHLVADFGKSFFKKYSKWDFIKLLTGHPLLVGELRTSQDLNKLFPEEDEW